VHAAGLARNDDQPATDREFRVTKLFLRRLPLIAAGAFLLATLVGPRAASAGDPAAGKDVFRAECSECHSIREGRNKKGPSLFGIVGRHAGSLPGYHYTDALERADWVWTPQKLQWYLSQPARKANPGTRMKYDGLDDAQQRDDLISFLGTVH
jgi:cytochrome c